MENEIFYGDSIASCEDNLMLMKGYKTAKKRGFHPTGKPVGFSPLIDK